MNQYTISALVSNKSGVLVRVAALFARRGYNIESLSVCKTENDALSRMTIVLNGDDYILGQMMKQMDKLVDVKKIQQVEESAVCRELLLAKVKTDAATRSQILEISQIFRAKVVDVSPEATILELTGKSSHAHALRRNGTCAHGRNGDRPRQSVHQGRDGL